MNFYVHQLSHNIVPILVTAKHNFSGVQKEHKKCRKLNKQHYRKIITQQFSFEVQRNASSGILPCDCK